MNAIQIFSGTKLRAVWNPACVVLLLLSGGVSASLGVISLEELTDRADFIVYGRVASLESIVSERDTAAGTLQILTAIVRIEPCRVLKGRTAEPIVVKAIENMEDSPGFKQGQKVFLFLKQNPDDSSFSVFGLTQGKFDVEEGQVVREQSSVDQFVRRLQGLIGMQQAR